MIKKTEKEVQILEEESGNLAEQVKINKKKLYEAKGSTLKELLSLQQVVLKLESQGQETEGKYWTLLKKIEECQEKKEQYQETIKTWQKEFNEGIEQYQKIKAEVELKLAEIKASRRKLEQLPQVQSYISAENIIR